MASIYSCRECGANLNLDAGHLFPADFYFEAGNKNTLSFSAVDSSKFQFEKEDKIRPFFETVNYWGIQRKRIKIKCNSCGKLVGYIYDDGPPLTDGIGQFGFGPSQVIPRNPRRLVIGTEHFIRSSFEISCRTSRTTSQPCNMKRYLRLKNQMVKSSVAASVTKQEIAYYWQQRRMVEEDHLYAAIKAAACVRARNLSDYDLLQFEVSLLDDDGDDIKENENGTKVSGTYNEGQETRVGIRDWWTKSRYAYLNQPEMKLVDGRRRQSWSHLPEFFRGKCASLPSSTY